MNPDVLLAKDYRVLERKVPPNILIQKYNIRKVLRPNNSFLDLVSPYFNTNNKLNTSILGKWNLDLNIEPSTEYYHIEFK